MYPSTFGVMEPGYAGRVLLKAPPAVVGGIKGQEAYQQRIAGRRRNRVRNRKWRIGHVPELVIPHPVSREAPVLTGFVGGSVYYPPGRFGQVFHDSFHTP